MNKNIKNSLVKIIFIVSVLILWQVLYTLKIWPEILFPSLGDIGKAFVTAFTERELGTMVLHSLSLIIKGLIVGIALALVFSSLSVIKRNILHNLQYDCFNVRLNTLGIALIPVAILWIGVGDGAIIFMVIHAVVWPMSRSIIDGFNAVPELYLEVGRNIGLSPVKLIFGVFLPAALPRIFSGIKVGWARAWRGLISAEMIFGGGGALGIGYFIQDRRTNTDIAGVFAAIIVIVIIGMVVEYGIFRNIENKTFRKWGMTR